MNELVAENQKARAKAEEAERSAAIRAELQRLGVAKVDLAYKAVKDDDLPERRRAADGAGRGGDAGVPDAVRRARIRSCCRRGWRADRERARGRRDAGTGTAVDLDKIRPGMSAEELERVRQEIARVASQTLRGCSETRHAKCSEERKRRKNGSNYISKCSECDCEAGGGGCAAGVDGEPGDGEPGQSRLRADAGAGGRHGERADSADAGGEQHRGRRHGARCRIRIWGMRRSC